MGMRNSRHLPTNPSTGTKWNFRKKKMKKNKRAPLRLYGLLAVDPVQVGLNFEISAPKAL